MAQNIHRVFPLMANAAEQLVAALCMRRNLMTFPAPPRNEGYDLACIHPDPRKVDKVIRIQVKSRYQCDCNDVFDFHPKSLGAFDYFAAVFLNTGFYYSKKKFAPEGLTDPQVYLLPHDFVRDHYAHRPTRSGMKVSRVDQQMRQFLCPQALEQVASVLEVPYPK